MEINLAKTAGFCFGVKRAVELTDEALRTEKNVYSIGDIVHNKYVINKLKQKGLTVVKSIDEIPDNATVIIRAHGVTKEQIKRCEEKNLKVIDTTCPNVKKLHSLAKKYSNEGYNIVIIGEAEHPEVVGIRGWCFNNEIVVNDNFDFNKLENLKNVCVLSQTTMNKKKNEDIIEKIKKYVENPLIFNTICSATDERQSELRMLAAESDVVIVIGDKMSSNSNRLYEIAKEICDNSYFIENNDELCLNFLDNSCKIGITASASTPDELIFKVVDSLKAVK